MSRTKIEQPVYVTTIMKFNGEKNHFRATKCIICPSQISLSF